MKRRYLVAASLALAAAAMFLAFRNPPACIVTAVAAVGMACRAARAPDTDPFPYDTNHWE